MKTMILITVFLCFSNILFGQDEKYDKFRKRAIVSQDSAFVFSAREIESGLDSMDIIEYKFINSISKSGKVKTHIFIKTPNIKIKHNVTDVRINDYMGSKAIACYINNLDYNYENTYILSVSVEDNMIFWKRRRMYQIVINMSENKICDECEKGELVAIGWYQKEIFIKKKYFDNFKYICFFNEDNQIENNQTIETWITLVTENR